MDRAEGDAISENIEVVPVVVVSQTFPARPSSIPDIRDFVRRCLAQSPLSEEDNREVGQTVAQALLDAAGPTGAINVSFRIFPDHVEVDVLRSGPNLGTPTSVNALTSFLNSGGSGASGALRAPGDGARRRRVVVRRLDGGHAPPGGHDDGGGRPSARRVGEDGQPLGGRRHRAATAGPAAHPRALRRHPVSLTGRRSAYRWAMAASTGTYRLGPDAGRVVI